MDIRSLKSAPEGKTVEFKRDASSAGPILRTVCAFANTAGGTLLFGIEDRTGAVVGVPEPLDLEERLASIIADGILPRVLPDIEVVPWRSTHVVAVRVHLGPSRPYHVASLGPEDGTFVRLGSTNRKADAQLVAEMARSAQGVGFDELPVAELGVDAIDIGTVRSAFGGVRDIRRADLKTLRLTATAQGREVPTTGGLLLFGTERLERFPDAWVQAGRFKGATKGSIIDSAEITVPPVEAVDQALAFVVRNTSLTYDVGRPRRLEIPEYPPVAVGEAIINAIVHADYSQTGAPIRISIFDDRLEVESPGMLVPGLTIADVLGGVSKLRNRVIGRVFRELGLIEQWGSGVARMREACSAAGVAEPLLEEVGTRFRVTLYSGRVATPGTDPVDAAALEALRAAGGLTTSELAAAIGRTSRATRTRLLRLMERGLVVDIGSGPTDPQRRYHVAEEPGRWTGGH
ncbi:MAG: putative DNA binding domain-containing protein [Coriobacteriia bacterium]|nr:putative DNA binding domain-containing protein [Coriobacteriia bacterium]